MTQTGPLRPPAGGAPVERFTSRMVFVLAFVLLEAFWASLQQPQAIVERGPIFAALFTAKWYVFTGVCLILGLFSIPRLRLPHSWAHVAMLMYITVGTFSTALTHHDPSEAFQRVISWWLLLLCAFWFRTPFDPIKRLRAWGNALTWSTVVFSAISCPLLADSSYYIRNRFLGLSDHPNSMAMIAACGIIQCVCKVLLPGRRWYRISWGIVVCGQGTILLATDSRGPRIMVVAVVAFLLFLVPKRRQRHWALAVLAAIIVAYLVGMSVSKNALGKDIQSREINLADRTAVWQRQFEIFTESPWIGFGFEFGNKTSGTGRAGGEGSYTDLLTAVGVAGVVPFVAALVTTAFGLWRLLRRFRRQGREEEVAALAPQFGIFVGTLILATSEGYLSAVGQCASIFCWVVMGAVPQLRAMMGPEPKREHGLIGYYTARSPVWQARDNPATVAP